MRNLPTLLALTLSFGIVTFPNSEEEPQDTPEKKLNWQERDQRSLETNIEGTWMLMNYSTPNEVEDPENFRGWAMFRDGYLSWMVYGAVRVRGLFGPREDISLEAMAFRYRIGPNLDLQLASMLGFSTLNEDGELEFDDGRTAFDYRVTIDQGVMTLRAGGQETFQFRKLAKTEFPRKALRALRLAGDADIFDEED